MNITIIALELWRKREGVEKIKMLRKLRAIENLYKENPPRFIVVKLYNAF